MTSKLGCHWIRVHPDGRDLAHIEAMQYPSVKLFEWHWSDADACANLLDVLPRDSYILARDHPMSEQEIWSDPVGIGTRQANEWADKVHSGRYKLPTDRSFFLGRNEPDATSGDRNAIDIYTEAFLDRLAVHGLRGGAFNFSTGHPRTVDGTGGTQADYSVFERSHQAIVRGHHIGVLHIYGTAAVPCAPGHYDRLRACTWQDVEWIVGECGIDQHVIGGGPHDGYLRVLGNPADYCRWLDEFIMGMASGPHANNDRRIHSYQVFTYDFSHPWDSFDTRPIRDALESYDWQHIKQPPIQVGEGPTPPVKTTTMFVQAPAGANLRLNPVTGDILTAIPYGAPVTVMDNDADAQWLIVRYEGITGWIRADLLSATPPDKPQPTPTPVGDKWQRSIEWVLAWEGEYQDHDNDKGNWTGCEVGKGEKKGTKWGISACSYPNLDIRNLSRQQAISIYERDYWMASTASALPWPACLLVLDTAVLHGVGTAKAWLAEAGPNPYVFAAKRLRSYTKMSNWDFWGKAWCLRVADLLEEMAK